MNNSLINLLHSCKNLRLLKSIHASLLIEGSITYSDLILNKILRLYSRLGAIDHARKIFDEITQPNAFLWTAIIHGHVNNHQFTEALCLFSQMRRKSVPPLSFTVSSVLKGLAREMRLKDGEALYAFVLRSGFDADLTVQNAILDFFMRCGGVEIARRIFDEMPEKDTVSWNLMISGYGNTVDIVIARELFDKMPERTVISFTTLICGYFKAGDTMEAKALFNAMPVKDLASCNVMISGYMESSYFAEAQLIFRAMPIHNTGTWNLMISGFCKAGKMDSARDYFSRMPNKNAASWAIIIDGYIKAGDVDSARCLFECMPEKNLVSWSSMIGGYAKKGQPRHALELFEQFKKQGIKPDDIFLLGIISACSQMGILDTAESIVCDYVTPMHLSNIQVVTSLIDMYSKCGSIDKAFEVFEMAYKKDLLCCSTMIAAFSNHGLGQKAISLFDEMKMANIKPDGVTFLGILSACNHTGLLNEGRKYFTQMSEEFGIEPSEKHYACYIDLLGRAGCLREAYNLICEMPIVPSSTIWGALLSACRVHRNIHLAEIAAFELFKIEPNNSGNYVLLSNLYADAGRWGDVAKVRAIVRANRVRKNRGSSWIDLGGAVHEFVMADVSHVHSDGIYLILDLLCEDIKIFSECLMDPEFLKKSNDAST